MVWEASHPQSSLVIPDGDDDDVGDATRCEYFETHFFLFWEFRAEARKRLSSFKDSETNSDQENVQEKSQRKVMVIEGSKHPWLEGEA